ESGQGGRAHRARQGSICLRCGHERQNRKGRRRGLRGRVNGRTLWNARGDDAFTTSCPVCGNRLLGDTEKGEQFCSKCGYATSAPADAGPEWKAMDLQEKNKRVRVGS